MSHAGENIMCSSNQKKNPESSSSSNVHLSDLGW